jgi:hypothetical protein
MRALDPTESPDREVASSHVRDVIGGALEATMPPGRCNLPRPPTQADAGSGAAPLVARACDGWKATVTMGARAGDVDSIVIRGPKKP